MSTRPNEGAPASTPEVTDNEAAIAFVAVLRAAPQPHMPDWKPIAVVLGRALIALRAQVATLTAERDEALTAMSSDGADAVSDNVVLRAKLATLQSQNDKLREALLRRIPKKQYGPWHHGLGCPAEETDGGNYPCTCGAWVEINADAALAAETGGGNG